MDVNVIIKINDENIKYDVIASEYKEICIGLISYYYIISISNMVSGKKYKRNYFIFPNGH